MKKNIPFLFLFLTIFLLVSCSKKIVFDEKIFFPNANWTHDDRIQTFQVPFSGSEKPYAIILELDLFGTPNVNMIDVYFSIFAPNGGKTVKSVVFNFNNPQEPYIQGASENEKIYRMVVYPKKYFSEGIYTIEVNKYSSNFNNYGIRALRLYVEKVKEKK
jgi:hypothetical protein